jgi:hypothetical protein
MRPMSREEFERTYTDTHEELAGVGILLEGQKALRRIEPGDKNAADVKKLKKPIEAKCLEKQREKLTNFILDTVAVRAKDVFDKKQLPMKDLLKVAVSAMPKQIDIEANVTNSVVDIWNTIEADYEVTDDS